MATAGGTLKKKQRVGSSGRLSSLLDSASFPDATLPDGAHKPPSLRRSSSRTILLPVVSSCPGGFNDSATGDVVLRLFLDQWCEMSDSPTSPQDQSEMQVYLHSHALRRSNYFTALLSDRWQQQEQQQQSESSSSNPENAPKIYRFELSVPSDNDSINNYLKVLQLLYSDDLMSSIDSVSTALALLPIALEFLFEDCVKVCLRFLEAVPWTDEEENKVLNLIPFLRKEESKELLTRVSPLKNDSSDEMLHGLIQSAIHNHPNMAFAKAFVAKLLRDFSSRDSARRVLEKVFEKSLRVVRQALEEYTSPVFRVDQNETEALQRLNLHTAMTNLKHLLWLVERMIELKVADTAVQAWSEQASLAADFQRALRDDAWRNIVPSLPTVVLRCTSRLANAVATGNVVASRQVRTKLVRDWLPMLIICKERGSLMGPAHKLSSSPYIELEETFLRIISTLPLSESQGLLQQCLSLSTRNVDDCPHLVAAFTTWFRRANRPPQPDSLQ
ncbi:BTB/POZ domain-containing protein At1g63850-like [Andrographis paniculata]|uniref:BTB/POZ domain-containing protein At1g63850-like n=1 Tax=Andrographis paniculata TaxID=175694 RepID=UPI0021E90717|nr:BTB/POZ domain-containing protein At1g63850-like [Andrographis paniculata]